MMIFPLFKRVYIHHYTKLGTPFFRLVDYNNIVQNASGKCRPCPTWEPNIYRTNLSPNARLSFVFLLSYTIVSCFSMCWIVQNLTVKYEWIRYHYLNGNNFSSCYHYMSSTSSHQHYPSWCPYIASHVFNQFRHLNYIWIYQFSMQILYITFEMFKPFGLHASKVFFIFLIIWFSNLSTLSVSDEGYSRTH